MSIQQDIYAAGSESRPPMLNKENYVPWSSRLLRYAKSRPNGKLIHNSILNGPYVRKMIPEPGDANRDIIVTETFHLQTDDELYDKELKQIEADDQAIQTILLGLPEDIYAALEWSRHVTIVHQTKDLHTADYTQSYDFLKYNQKENYLQQPMPNLKDITDPTTAMNMALALMAKAFKLNYSTPTNNNQIISSNPRNRQIAQSSMNMGQDRQMEMIGGNGGNQFRQYAGQNAGNPTGYNDVIANQAIQNAVQNPRVQNVGNQNGLIGGQRNGNQNQNGNGNLVAARAEGNTAGQNGNQIRCYNYKRVAGFESRPPMLNKENYVPWSSRLLRYAKSRSNRNLIHNSILNGPYTILLGLPEDIYAVVNSCETAQEIWLRVQQIMKGSDIGIQEKKAKLFNEWERFTSNEGESIESYYHSDYTQLYDFLKYNQKEVDELKAERLAKTQDPLALMANSNNPYAFPAPHQDQPSFNQNYLQQPMQNPEDITDPTTAMNMALILMAKAFKLNYSTPTNNNQKILSNPRNRQIAQPGMNIGQDRQIQMVEGNGGNQFRQYAGQNAGNPAGYNDNGLVGVQGNGNQNQIENGNLVTARAGRNATRQNGNQIRCYNCRGVEKYDLMDAAADLDEIKEVNANCILMANLQQASTSGTQTDSTPVYDTDGSAKVHENCDYNEIFNMFTQEEQYTKLLVPIPESHQVLQNDNDVISEDTSVEQGGETVEQHHANFEETRALYESLY
uniref:Uncharacterized protein n=1 Tax=Tanacetum cinerariifolium TaxID=118510 RepID=A0A6L2LB19_TANCI|nr:hypothetical protein [Tanacetum cinerariifolium]